ncbi:hypothetical protein GEMRC1_003377 [Eukaryota sp. GEM-RC1]
MSSTIPAEVLCSTLVEKLLLLNYEDRFCYPKEFPLLNHLYFTVPASNRSEQYYYFASLASWLLRLCGIDAPQPFQSDDPGDTAKNLLNYCREADIDVDLDHAKLRQGFGDSPALLLSLLADAAILRTNITFEKIQYPDDPLENEASEGESDISETFDEGGDFTMNMEAIETTEEGLEMDVEAINAWRNEVERVLPKLSVHHNQGDHNDWSIKVSQLKSVVTKCVSVRDSVLPLLGVFSSDTKKTLSKISHREQFLQEQLGHLVQEYASVRTQLETLQQNLSKVAKLKSDRTTQLQNIARELDDVKEATDQRGSQISNTEPLIALRKEGQGLVKSTKNLTLRLAVTEQNLLRLRERSMTEVREEVAEFVLF